MGYLNEMVNFLRMYLNFIELEEIVSLNRYKISLKVGCIIKKKIF